MRPSRRQVLTWTGAGAVTALSGLGAPRAYAAPDAPLRFAMFTDCHANVDYPARRDDLARCLEHAASYDPEFVLSCGDLTDYGVDEEFAVYKACIPASLKDRMRNVPGNHESSWDATAMEAYRRAFGPTHYSFDAGGIHFVALDPMVSLEQAWYYGPHLLEWLRSDLERVGRARPVAVFQHFPIAGPNYFVNDTEDFLRIIRPHNVRALFAGHIHHTQVLRFNGVTQVVGNAGINGPYYYWIERANSADGPVLEVTEVVVPKGAAPTRRALATVPLGHPDAGRTLGPFSTAVEVAGSVARVTVTLPVGAQVDATASALIHPQGGPAGTWVPLASGGRRPDRRRTAALDITALPPGEHRMQLRATERDDTFEDIVPFRIPGGRTHVAWQHQLDGRIQGPLAESGGLVVAATVRGEVAAFRAAPSGPAIEWSTRLGPAYKGGLFTPDGSHIVVPSADHHFYALDPASGETLWRTDVSAPSTAEVTMAAIDGETHVLGCAGDRLFCVDSAGRVRWSSDLHGIFTGKVACDGNRVYAGSGSGSAYAFDARTGQELWSTTVTNKNDSYRWLIYGCWAGQVVLLPDGAVLFNAFENAYSLDGATGKVRWVRPGNFIYTPPLLTEHGLLLVDAGQTARMLAPDSGAVTWSAPVLPKNYNAGPMLAPRGDVAWLPGLTGRLVRIELATGQTDQALQVTPALTFSTGVVVGTDTDPLLATGWQDGMLRCVAGLW